MPSPWFLQPRRASIGRVRLFCIPFAGAGATALYPWAAALPESIEPVLVQLPGRENRLREEPFRQAPALVRALTEAIHPELDRPYGLLGYSLGAILAFELARALRERGAPAPRRLFAAARRAPHLPDPEPGFSHLPDAAFSIQLQQRYGGIPAAMWENPELLALFLPTLRADIALMDGYECLPGEPLGCPISVFGGLDDAHVSEEALTAWQQHTNAGCRLRLLPGGHFFLHAARDAFAGAVVDDLSPWFQDGRSG